jgi:hypothetical protein
VQLDPSVTFCHVASPRHSLEHADDQPGKVGGRYVLQGEVLPQQDIIVRKTDLEKRLKVNNVVLFRLASQTPSFGPV